MKNFRKHSLLKKLFLHHVVKRGIKKSHSVVAVSEYTKAEILKYHKHVCLAEKIRVVHEGYEHLTSIVINNEDEFVKKLLNFKEKFFLYIGSSRGHKNLHNLFLGYEKSGIDWKLVIVGRMDRLEESDKELVEAINKEKERIVFTGWIDDIQMYTILSHANAFVFPSKSEGFGIPILESYYFNVPLLCSDIPVFNEVAGNACIKFNPFNIDDIATCFVNFRNIKDEELEDLLQKQKVQLRKYSWKSAAAAIHELLVKEMANKKYSVARKKNIGCNTMRGGVVYNLYSQVAAYCNRSAA